MRMRGGGAVETCCAVGTGRVSIPAAVEGDDADAHAADEDFARLRFGGRFLVALAADLLAAEMGRAAIVAAGAAAGADDDDAAIVVASPKSTAKASLAASGAAGLASGGAGSCVYVCARVFGAAGLIWLRRRFVFWTWAYRGRGGPTVGDFGRRAMLLSPRIAPRSAS